MSSYWEIYKEKSDDFIEGIIAGITAYAVWKDGKQLIGVSERLLKEEINEIKEVLQYKGEIS